LKDVAEVVKARNPDVTAKILAGHEASWQQRLAR
jgi:hypothetical protein